MKRVIVEVDYWENQRYTLRGWSTPFQTAGKVPPYSDIDGRIALDSEVIKSNNIFLPVGWEWCQSEWTIDFSGTYGEVDEEGWSYASTFETLLENSRTKQLHNERSNLHIVRRRRWIRGRKCVANAERAKYMACVEWTESLRTKIEEMKTVSQTDFMKLSTHYENQDRSMRQVVIAADRTLKNVICSLSHMRGQLVAMRSFLAERGLVENQYSKKIDSLAMKWINVKAIQQKFFPDSAATADSYQTGSAAPSNEVTNSADKRGAPVPRRKSSFFSSTPFSGMFSAEDSVLPSTDDQHVNTVSDASTMDSSVSEDAEDGVADDFVSAPDPTSGAVVDTSKVLQISLHNNSDETASSDTSSGDGNFFQVVSAANLSIAKRLEEFSRLLNEALPRDVANIIAEVDEAIQDCRSEGNRMRMLINTRVKKAQSSFEVYCRCYDHAALTLSLESDYLYAAIYHADAASEFQRYILRSSKAVKNNASNDSTAAVLSVGGYTDAESSGSAPVSVTSTFANLENIDIWLAIQLYSQEVTDIDSALLMYNAFSKLQWKKLQDIVGVVEDLLKSVMKIFVHEQFRVWQDSASMLEAVGISTNTLLLHTAGSSDIKKLEEQMQRNPIDSLIRADGDDKRSQDNDDKNNGSTQSASLLIEGSNTNAGLPSNNSDLDLCSRSFFSVFSHKSYIAYHGRLSYCTTSSSSSSASNSNAGSGNMKSREELAEHSMWDDALVIMTYNRVLHLLKPPSRASMSITNDSSDDSYDPLKVYRDRLILSMNCIGASASAVYIPKEGYRDAFEVVPSSVTRKKGSFFGSLMGSSKDISSIVFITNDALDVQTWIRVIGNPFADPSREPVSGPVFQAPVKPMQVPTSSPTNSPLIPIAVDDNDPTIAGENPQHRANWV